jgi:hypothetical protein
MTRIRAGRKLAIAAAVVATAVGSAAPANAAEHDRCDGGEQRLEQRFRQIEEKRGYEAAVKWWEKAWERYYERCLAP